jgi:hypothetical protein
VTTSIITTECGTTFATEIMTTGTAAMNVNTITTTAVELVRGMALLSAAQVAQRWARFLEAGSREHSSEALLGPDWEHSAANWRRAMTTTTITITRRIQMKLKSICCMGILALLLVPMSVRPTFAQDSGSSAAQNSADTQTPSIPIEKLVTATCRQAWHMGGKTQEGFFAIVKQLAALSAQNRGVTLPDNKEAGARAGEWIRTQALKDPDQLLYAVVDQAVQKSIAAGRSKPASATNTQPDKQ